MKVNIVILTIALFVTENSAIHLKNFLSDESDISDDTLLNTEPQLLKKFADARNTN